MNQPNSSLDPQLEMVQTASQLSTGDIGAAFLHMLLCLAVLIALILVSYWFLKRLLQKRWQKESNLATIQILEKRAISPKTQLYLIRVGQKKVLIAESHLEIKRLESLAIEELDSTKDG